MPAFATALVPLAREDFGAVAELARTIWLAHYAHIVPREQIEYMLEGRFTPANLERYIGADDRWMHVLKAGGDAVGYCSHSLTGMPREMKLEQLYLLPALHGRGLGKSMLERIEAHARQLGCDTLMLQVNKRNTGSIRVYERGGFTVREEKVFDIGHGYVMDDYVMQKSLGARTL